MLTDDIEAIMASEEVAVLINQENVWYLKERLRSLIEKAYWTGYANGLLFEEEYGRQEE